MARRNPGLLGWLFGGRSSRRKKSGRRTAAPKRAAAKKAARVPSIRTGRGPAGAATRKAAAMRAQKKLSPRQLERQRAERRQAELLAKFERGTITGPELREFLRDARTARNPAAVSALRARAERASETFHGRGFRDVVQLTKAEQRKYGLPEWVTPIGRKNAIEYVPPAGSKRAGATWRHRAGDRGRGKPAARRVGLLVADPRDGRTVEIGGSERFRPGHGLVG